MGACWWLATRATFANLDTMHSYTRNRSKRKFASVRHQRCQCGAGITTQETPQSHQAVPKRLQQDIDNLVISYLSLL